MHIIKKIYAPFVILLLSYWAIRPLFISGFFPMHDDTQPSRVFEMGKVLKEGMFPVRWIPDLAYGYGYPLFNFYAPLSYYIGGMLTVFGIDALVATKLIMGFAVILSGIFMYLFAKEYWGKVCGIVAALFYIYAPFHAVDMYVRGDIAELFAYAFIPFTFFGLLQLYKKQNWFSVALFSVGFAALILSHNLTAMMTTPFLIFYALFLFFSLPKNKQKKQFLLFFISFLLALALSAFYWLPALLEMKYTNVLSQIGGRADYADHFVCFSQLWNSIWGYGGSISGCVDGLSFQIGKFHIASIAGLILLVFIKKINHRNISILAIVGFFFSVFLCLKVSRPVWDILSPMAFFQYPWRFLLFTSFFSSFTAGSLFENSIFFHKSIFVKKLTLLFTVVFAVVFVFVSERYFHPQTISPKSALSYTSEEALKWDISKISDEYMPADFQKPLSKNDIVHTPIVIEQGRASIQLHQHTSLHLAATVKSIVKSTVLLNIAYFPAWKVKVDNKEVQYRITNRGLTIFLAPGIHEIFAYFEQTTVEKIASGISCISIIVLLVGIIVSNRKKSLP